MRLVKSKIILWVTIGLLLAACVFVFWGTKTETKQRVFYPPSERTSPDSHVSPIPNDSLDFEFIKQKAILEKKAFVPVTTLQSRRVDTIAQESIDQVIANLAGFDDYHFATTSSPRSFSPGSPESVGMMLPNLFRVRRLLEEAERDHKLIAQKMKDALADALMRWPEAFKNELAMRIEFDRQKIPMIKDAPTEHDKVRLQTQVATYVLAEMPDHTALPVLIQSYRKQQEWIDAIPVEKYAWIPQCPVPPPISLYAMHRLVSTYPLTERSDAAMTAHKAYMQWADAHLPELKRYEGVRSKSKYDESDPRNIMADREGLLQVNEPKISLTIYPAYFKDRSGMQKYLAGPYMTDRSKEWFKLIESFADAIK
jgi:hypothetical protein